MDSDLAVALLAALQWDSAAGAAGELAAGAMAQWAAQATGDPVPEDGANTIPTMDLMDMVLVAEESAKDDSQEESDRRSGQE